MTDLLIIGGGPAGLTAALYGLRAGKSVTVCERETFGGQITQAQKVDNYPGLPGISGMELGDRLLSQAMDLGLEVEVSTAGSLSKEEGRFLVTTEDGTLESRSVIYAGGAGPRHLGLPGEAELVGRGLSYCALCDGAFCQDQDAAVVGGGNTAFSDALFLSSLCRSVTLIHRRTAFRAEPGLVEAVRNLPNVRLLVPNQIQALLGSEELEGVQLQDQILPVQGLFVALGRVPECSLLGDLAQLDDQGYALAGEDCCTRTPGLFVAGDCRRKAIRQLTTAVSDGTAAALAACSYVDRQCRTPEI